MKLTYEELDSKKLRGAIARMEETVIVVASQHANALDLLVDLVADIKSWPERKPSLLEKWIVLQKAFFLAVRSLFFHGQLVELLPALLSSEIQARRSHQSDGSVVLRIQPK